jgi:demethylmenaquinone methyltransferase/2-methoxy-6-polyprenyl-1,4-benzoquinol methylase
MISHFDLAAPVYDRILGRLDMDTLYRLLKLPVAGALLDAGGGTGRVSWPIRSKTGQVVVSDLSFAMLNRARQKGGVQTLQAHAEKLPFDDGTFERIVVVDALHHFCDQEAAIRDLLRVLAKGGRLVIEEPDIHRVPVKIIAIMEKLAFMRSHFLSAERIARIVGKNGYNATTRTGHPASAWVIVDK